MRNIYKENKHYVRHNDYDHFKTNSTLQITMGICCLFFTPSYVTIVIISIVIISIISREFQTAASSLM